MASYGDKQPTAILLICMCTSLIGNTLSASLIQTDLNTTDSQPIGNSDTVKLKNYLIRLSKDLPTSESTEEINQLVDDAHLELLMVSLVNTGISRHWLEQIVSKMDTESRFLRSWNVLRHVLVSLPECKRDSDCALDKACYNKCDDPCLVENPCGRRALCTVETHRAVCYCPEGWFGNPLQQCYTVGCTVDSDCPTDKACITNKCVNPCTFDGNDCGIRSLCRTVLHKEQCYCPAGLQGNPQIACITVGCRSDEDCPDDKACDNRNGVCLNICHKDTCASKATCEVVNHVTMCFCPFGYEGNPVISCNRPRDPLPPKAVLATGCRRDYECPAEYRIPCKLSNPCLATQKFRVTAGNKIMRTNQTAVKWSLYLSCKSPSPFVIFFLKLYDSRINVYGV